jgi:hypothetical protein
MTMELKLLAMNVSDVGIKAALSKCELYISEKTILLAFKLTHVIFVACMRQKLQKNFCGGSMQNLKCCMIFAPLRHRNCMT